MGKKRKKNVSKVNPNSKQKDWRQKKMRVVAYARLSADGCDQENSLKNQKKHYADTISANPNWKYVGLYADDGIRITSTRNRDGFNRMIEDCKSGKIDLVVVKDVSRFAKNIVDCRKTVELLLSFDPPVGIYFEKNNINTLDADNMIFLTVLAIVEEYEREVRSQSVKAGLRRKEEKHGKKS